MSGLFQPDFTVLPDPGRPAPRCVRSSGIGSFASFPFIQIRVSATRPGLFLPSSYFFVLPLPSFAPMLEHSNPIPQLHVAV